MALGRPAGDAWVRRAAMDLADALLHPGCRWSRPCATSDGLRCRSGAGRPAKCLWGGSSGSNSDVDVLAVRRRIGDRPVGELGPTL